jgi:predicted permease
MDLFVTTFESVAVLLGIGFIGFWIIRKRILPENALSILSPLALDIALPSLVFVKILTDFSPRDYPDWWLLPMWWVAFMGIAAVLTFVLRYISEKKTRQEFAISLFFQNGIFVPLALLSGMFADSSEYLVYLFLFTMFYPAFFFNTYFFFFGQKIKELNWKKVVNPVLIATIVALVIVLLDVKRYFPDIGVSILNLLGAMALPIIMLIIGGNIYLDFQRKGEVYWMEIFKFVLIKNWVFPLIFLGIVVVVHPPFHVALLLMLQSAVPPVTSVPIFTERAGGNFSIVNQFLVGSFVVSLVSIPVMLTLFTMLY